VFELNRGHDASGRIECRETQLDGISKEIYHDVLMGDFAMPEARQLRDGR
jgi:hypothetical protein